MPERKYNDESCICLTGKGEKNTFDEFMECIKKMENIFIRENMRIHKGLYLNNDFVF